MFKKKIQIWKDIIDSFNNKYFWMFLETSFVIVVEKSIQLQ